MPVTTQRKEDACCEADTECEQADHVGCDRKSNDLAADRNGKPSVRSRKNTVGGLDEPVIQLIFGRQALALVENLLPLVFRYQVALHQGIRREPTVQFLERVGICPTFACNFARYLATERADADELLRGHQRQSSVFSIPFASPPMQRRMIDPVARYQYQMSFAFGCKLPQ